MDPLEKFISSVWFWAALAVAGIGSAWQVIDEIKRNLLERKLKGGFHE